MNREQKLRELEELKSKVRALEEQLEAEPETASWVPSGYYTTYHILAGMILGLFGAIASLLFNVVGSLLVKQHPLELIRVYLTFPLGERALQVESGAILALGCCLYLMTGAFYGVPFHLVLSRFFDKTSIALRFTIASILGLALWGTNFYVLLAWLQPKLFGGDWIVTMIPAWVGALTHLVFAWTMLILDEWGKFDHEGHVAAGIKS